MTWRRFWFVVVLALGVGVWLIPNAVVFLVGSAGYDASKHPPSHRLSKLVKDDRPRFAIDPGQPWQIAFGRGSGWNGLNTITLDQDGCITLFRLTEARLRDENVLSWETTTAQLSPDAVAMVLEALVSNRLMQLEKAYHADVRDGTQWVLRMRQGEREKAVYFDNHFPDPISRFAVRLDEIIAGSVGPGLRWRAVLALDSRNHERELWDSINR